MANILHTQITLNVRGMVKAFIWGLFMVFVELRGGEYDVPGWCRDGFVSNLASDDDDGWLTSRP